MTHVSQSVTAGTQSQSALSAKGANSQETEIGLDTNIPKICATHLLATAHNFDLLKLVTD